jgi:hypothetical protein
MIDQHEWTTIVRSNGFEHGISVKKTPIEYADLGFIFGNPTSIDVNKRSGFDHKTLLPQKRRIGCPMPHFRAQ